MLTMDAFQGDAFQATSLTAAVDKMGYVPGYLSGLPGLVQPVPVRTTAVWIEERANQPVLIQTSPRGAPPAQKGGDKRTARAFQTVRLADASRITSEELQGIRAFGSETELKSLQLEVARRQMKMKQDFALTKENMLLGCVQGVVTDADGSVIYDWGAEFGQSPIAEVPFDLSNATPVMGALYIACNNIRRSIMKNLKGVGGGAVMVHAIVGDTFWDKFTQHAEVRQTYQYAMAALQLQNEHGGAWESFRFGNIMFHNYRGSDDSVVQVGTNSAKFFPVNAGIFQVAYSPAESFGFANTPGQESYSWIIPDRDRDAFAAIEMYSYPLYVCTMPSALASARAGA